MQAREGGKRMRMLLQETSARARTGEQHRCRLQRAQQENQELHARIAIQRASL